METFQFVCVGGGGGGVGMSNGSVKNCCRAFMSSVDGDGPTTVLH